MFKNGIPPTQPPPAKTKPVTLQCRNEFRMMFCQGNALQCGINFAYFPGCTVRTGDALPSELGIPAECSRELSARGYVEE
eukprot:4364162-Amphidinium_carterae.1